MLQPELGDLLRDHAVRHSIPGAALGVMVGSSVVTAFYGVADLGTDSPVTTSTRFGIGSLTKPLTATLLADLASEDTVHLDAPISEQLPELAQSRWASSATPTALLAGLSRIPLRYDWEFGLEGDSDDALCEVTVMVAGADPAGPHWSYSNLAFTVLGRLIEHVTGLPWEEATQRRLLEPLGMTSTAFARSTSTGARATGYEIGPDRASPADPWECRAYCSAGTSVVSTVADLLRFARRHLDDPDLAFLRTRRSDISIYGWLDSWGLAWAMFDWETSPVWGWDGVIPGQRAVLRLLPERDAAVALLTNGSTGRAMYRSLFTELLDAWFEVTVPDFRLETEAPVELDLQRYVGTYSWPDKRFEMSAEDGALVVITDDSRTKATPLDQHIFVIDPSDPDTPTMTFADFDDDGRPRVVYRMLWGFPRT